MQSDREPDARRVADDTAEELAVRAQAGGADGMAAFSELVDRYDGRLYHFLLRRLTAADAEDVAQEAFIRAWERIGYYDSRYRFSTWLFTIAIRLAISHGRSLRRRVDGGEGGSNEADGWQGPRSDPGDRSMRMEEGTRLLDAVGSILNADQHTAVWLRYVEGMAIGDIARSMGRTQVGVRVMLFRARNLLAERLALTDDGDLSVEPVFNTGQKGSSPPEAANGVSADSHQASRCAGGAA